MLRRYPNKDNEDEKAAVLAAINQIRNTPGGEDKLRLVEMVYFKNTHTLQGAALNIPCGYETAKRWQQQFIKAVGENFTCNGLKE